MGSSRIGGSSSGNIFSNTNYINYVEIFKGFEELNNLVHSKPRINAPKSNFKNFQLKGDNAEKVIRLQKQLKEIIEEYNKFIDEG